MIRASASTVVAAPVEQVWDLLCDTQRYAEYIEGTDAVTRTDGPAAPGVTYDEVNPILGPWKARPTWTVVEFDAPRRQRHTTDGIPLCRTFAVTIETAADGDGCRITFTLEGEPSLGPVGAVFARLMQGQVERDNRKSVANLAELIGREQPARASVA